MDERDQRIGALGAEVERLRSRLRDERQAAEATGRATIVREFFDLVDDCDRLLEMVSEDPELVRGIESSRERIITRFRDLGYSPCGLVGERFDPALHEAIDTVPGPEEGLIVRVYSRGWSEDGGQLIRAARVTVSRKASL